MGLLKIKSVSIGIYSCHIAISSSCCSYALKSPQYSGSKALHISGLEIKIKFKFCENVFLLCESLLNIYYMTLCYFLIQDLSSFVTKGVKEIEHVMNVGNQNRSVG